VDARKKPRNYLRRVVSYHENYLNKAVGVYCLGATSTQTEYRLSYGPGAWAIDTQPPALPVPPSQCRSHGRSATRALAAAAVFLFLVAVDTEARLPASCVGDVQLLEQLGVPS
jgi:hypothetical protein